MVSTSRRRFGHQTTVVDSKLYTDGGLVNWNPMSTDPQNLLEHMAPIPRFKPERSQRNVPATRQPIGKRLLARCKGGIIWADDVNKRFYLFGGEYFQQLPTATFNLYSYDVLNDYWESFGPIGQSEISP
ncbi:unnamed protein product [Discula destructiva]